MDEPRILYKDITVSTMDDARIAVEKGSGDWTVCMAGSQTGGRGRLPGRQWEDSGESLLFTLVIGRNRYQASYPPTQMMALALCRHLVEDYGLEPRIKWPNDVFLGDRKIAGILVETEGPWFLAGMGLNLTQKSFPDSLRSPAVSLAEVLAEAGRGEAVSSDSELSLILNQILRLLDRPADIREIADYLYNPGSEVTVALGDPSRNNLCTGIVAGLQEDGALVLRTKDGNIRPVYSGEMAENS